MDTTRQPFFPDPAAAAALAGGVLLFGRYRVVRELGRGGMGLVLLAHDEELAIDIAVKLIPEMLVQDQGHLAELKHEVLRGVALTHPGIVRTHGFVRDSQMAAIVMEFVDGGNFTDLKHAYPGGCLDTADLHPWLAQLCPVLDYAHFDIRIAHRDLKPRNLMYSNAGRIKVADFGISSIINDTASRVTMPGSSSGTPAYMSPQQVMGGRPTHLDDIYGLGATIYEMLTGKPPFYQGQVLAQVLDATPVPMAERRADFGLDGKAPIPPAWEETVAACLAKDPAKRPQSAGEFLARLNPESTIHVTTRGRNRAPAASPAARRSKMWIPSAILTAFLAAGVAYLATRPALEKAGPATTAPAVVVVPLDPVAPEPAPLRIAAPDELPPGKAGVPYSYIPTAEDAATPSVWSISSGRLPEGLEMAAAGGISGTPLREEAAAFIVKATAGRVSAAKPIRLVILPADPPPAPEPVPPAEPQAVAETAPPMIPANREDPFVNSLGMRFVPAGTPDVLFSIWLTRIQDFRAFAKAASYDATPDLHTVQLGGKYGFIHQPEKNYSWEDPGFGQLDDSPVCGVSYDDARAFCQWLTKRENKSGTLPAGFEYRLPLDAEWQASLGLPPPAGNARRYPWGAAWPPPDGSNFAGGEMRDGRQTPTDWPLIGQQYRDRFPRTNPVDYFTGNAFGIHDSYGNLWQCCEDLPDPSKPSHLLRGGSWATADRDELDIDRPSKVRGANFRLSDAGFRCVIVRTQPATP